MRPFDQLDQVGVEGHEVEVATDVSWQLGARSSCFDICRASGHQGVAVPLGGDDDAPLGGARSWIDLRRVPHANVPHALAGVAPDASLAAV